MLSTEGISPDNSILIGVDLGTMKSCVSCYINGQVTIVKNREGGRTTPVALYFSDDDVIVGQQAQVLTNLDPQSGVSEIKKIIGKQYSELEGSLKSLPFKVVNNLGRPLISLETHKSVKMAPEKIYTYILRQIKKDVEMWLNSTVDTVVIAVPAHFNNQQHYSISESALAAGFTVVKFIKEPTAALVAYYHESGAKPRDYSLVFDFGGSNCTATILKNCQNFEIISTHSDTNLGGEVIDEAVRNYVQVLIEKKHGYFPELGAVGARKLKNRCETAKKRLSTRSETIIIFDELAKTGDVYEIKLSRKKFEEIAANLLERALDVLVKCVEGSKVPKNLIGGVIMAGGSSRIPKVQEMVSHYFNGRCINRFVNPEECVAEGVALQAAMLRNNYQ